MLYSKTDEEVGLIVRALRAMEKSQESMTDKLITGQLADRLEKERKEQRQDLIDYADVIEQARDKYALPSDDDLEIDDEPVLSKGDDGIWVNAWVWIRTRKRTLKELLDNSD